MIRINLLPHREMRRERRKKDFVALVILTLVLGAGVALAVALAIGGQIDAQRARNDFITRENTKLDGEIKEIVTLSQEIESLKARQGAVENLQRDRTLPVHMMDELVRQTPEGVQLRQVKQLERKVSLTGFAQSNEQVSALLRNLSRETPWLERPELVEIKATLLKSADPKDKDKEARRVFEFAVNVLVKQPQPPADDKPAATPKPAPAKPVATAPARARVAVAAID